MYLKKTNIFFSICTVTVRKPQGQLDLPTNNADGARKKAISKQCILIRVTIHSVLVVKYGHLHVENMLFSS